MAVTETAQRLRQLTGRVPAGARMCVLCVAPHGEGTVDTHIGGTRTNPTKRVRR